MRREEKKGEEKRLVGRVVARCLQVCTVKQREQEEKGTAERRGAGLGISLSLSLSLGFEVSAKDGLDGGVLVADGVVQGVVAGI